MCVLNKNKQFNEYLVRKCDEHFDSSTWKLKCPLQLSNTLLLFFNQRSSLSKTNLYSFYCWL